jgi:transcriptional regulator with XRE-family HTH domain
MPLARKISRYAVRFGKIIRRLRMQRGWTLAKLAQRSGMNAQYLGHLERAENSPSLDTIVELADVLGADIGEVMREVATGQTPAGEPPATAV